MTTTFSKEYIQQVTESLINSTPAEVIEFSQVIQSHPHGKELAAAITQEMFGRLTEKIMDSLGATEIEEEEYCGDTCGYYDEDDYEEEVNLSDVLARQISQKQLSEQIRAELAKQELSKSIAAQTRPVAVPAGDLHLLIKKQVEEKSLSESIAKQLANRFASQEATAEAEFSLEEVVESILDEIVDEVIEKGLIEDTFSLHLLSVELYEIVFSGLFYAKAVSKGITEIVEYKTDYTAYIMTEIADELVAQGYELAFQVVEGQIIPTLTI